MSGTHAVRLARWGAAVGIALAASFGFGQAAQAQVDPYPTVSEPDPVPTTDIDVENETEVQVPGDTQDSEVAVDDSELARTGTDSGRAALLGLAALGAGGVCVSAARKRATA